MVIVFLFPLNAGVSPCFHCTVLVPVYRVYTVKPLSRRHHHRDLKIVSVR